MLEDRMLTYRRIGLTVKPLLEDKDEAVRHVVDILRSTGAEIYIDAPNMTDVSCTRMFPAIADGPGIDALLVIGGDGTILRAVRELSDLSTPILSVNRGVVGFLAEILIEEASDMLPRLLSGEGVLEERTLLHVSVERESETIFDSFALNEAAVSQGAIARLLDLRTGVNGEPLATFHADGLIVATPTGSTAYSLAAGGPVVHPHLDAMILTPINPHSLTQKPVVIPGRSIVHMDVPRVGDGSLQTHVSLTLDGQVYIELQKDDRVTITMHDQTVKFLRRGADTFFHTLRTKLRWGERV